MKKKIHMNIYIIEIIRKRNEEAKELNQKVETENAGPEKVLNTKKERRESRIKCAGKIKWIEPKTRKKKKFRRKNAKRLLLYIYLTWWF